MDKEIKDTQDQIAYLQKETKRIENVNNDNREKLEKAKLIEKTLNRQIAETREQLEEKKLNLDTLKNELKSLQSSHQQATEEGKSLIDEICLQKNQNDLLEKELGELKRQL